MNKQQAYNRIATATIKALKEQQEIGKVNQLTTEAVYLAIDKAFSQEYSQLFSQIEQLKTTVQFIANGQELESTQMVTLAQQCLSDLK